MDNEVENPFEDTSPNFGNLPYEIILHILKNLRLADLKSASLTCKRWSEASKVAMLQIHAMVKFQQHLIADAEPPISFYLNSNQYFPRITFEKCDFGFMDRFLHTIVPHIEEISIVNCDIQQRQFKQILRYLIKLRKLTIVSTSGLFMVGQFFETDDDKKLLNSALTNLKSLSLSSNRYVCDAILERFTSSPSELQELDISGCHIAFHNALQRRFYIATEVYLPSEAILSFNFVFNVIDSHAKNLQSLNFSRTLIGGDALQHLSLIKMPKLKKIDLSRCMQLNTVGLISFFTAHSDIEYLDLSYSRTIKDESMKVIVAKLPLLKLLKITKTGVTDESVILFSKLKMLRVLDISLCPLITITALIEGIAAARNDTMTELYLNRISLNEQTLLQCCENLPNLQVFDIGYCTSGVSNRVVQTIIKKLTNLEVLNLEGCVNITDDAITDGLMSRIQDDLLAKVKNGSAAYGSTSGLFTNSYFGRNLSGHIRIPLGGKYEQEIVRNVSQNKIIETYENRIENIKNESTTDKNSLKNLKRLRALNLTDCIQITNVSLKYGFEFNELRDLSLRGSKQINISGIEALVENCPAIENLDLSECFELTDEAIQIIGTRLKRLRSLHINQCCKLTENIEKYLFETCPLLKVKFHFKLIEPQIIYGCPTFMEKSDVWSKILGIKDIRLCLDTFWRKVIRLKNF